MIDLRTLQPLDTDTILNSVEKTKRLLVVDHDFGPCGIAAANRLVREVPLSCVQIPLVYITLSFCPHISTLSRNYYPTTRDIVSKVLSMLDREEYINDLIRVICMMFQIRLLRGLFDQMNTLFSSEICTIPN